ncbi:tripartite tricarboxylate transporter TctB family protein [Solirhodobacter olei]|uniref:tripartite tricarboxylate transporter TctB family protein n=1 Tax=Solirhodobacter olei TaxID=2493082 RepID=UPI000FD9F648|nr:tripartite tricarboxylate transporter TctB family protein [Solirhodobacter olei]
MARLRERRLIGELVVSAGFLALSLLVFEQIVVVFAPEGAASGGALQNAALYPGLLAGALAALTLVQIGKTLTARRAPKIEPDQDNGRVAPEDAEWIRAFICTAAFVCYLIALPPIGYQLATPVLMFILYRSLGETSLFKVAFFAIATSLAASFVFERLLDVILPVGRFGIGY